MTIDITPLDEEFDTMMDVSRDPYGAWQAIQFLSAALERSEESRLEAIRRRDKWKAKAEGFEAVRLALREKIGSPWPPSLSRALWAGIAADEKARADTAEAALAASQAETAAAYEAAIGAVRQADAECKGAYGACENIHALTTTDSKAALDRMIAEARARGMREAAGVVDEKYALGEMGNPGHHILAAIPKGTDHE